MKGKYKFFTIAIALIFAVTLCITSVFVGAESENDKKTYEIAMVFDNSGSMYQNESWCRAKYAMEIFASMVDFKKDALKIYPMWQVTTDGSHDGGSYAPIKINSVGDIDKISNMFTVFCEHTPFEAVEDAYNGLKVSTADEKWLIVMTDGAFDQYKRGETLDSTIPADELTMKLKNLITGGIKLQYLGFGSASELKSDTDNGFYVKNSTSESLQNDLIEICNTIFNRDTLDEKKYIRGEKLLLDISMRKTIVFAQGDGAKINSLTSKDSGGTVDKLQDSGQRKYSEIRAKDYPDAPIDDRLAGQVTVFGACIRGQYILDYTDVSADKLRIFYEPDVKLDLTVKDSNGNVMDENSKFVEGDYTVTGRIIDAQTGEDVTEHPLMGGNVDIKIKVKTSQDSDYTYYPNGSTISLKEDKGTKIGADGTYLKDSKITTDDNSDLDWLNPIEVIPRGPELVISANVLQKARWYVLSKHENWKPIRVTFAIDGQPLTDEQLGRCAIIIPGEKKFTYSYVKVPGESAYDIYIGKDDDGNYVQPDKGKYKCQITAEYTDEHGTVSPSNAADVKFTVASWALLWKILFILGIILAVLALIAAWLLHPVLPKKAYFVYAPNKYLFMNVKRGNVSVPCRFDTSHAAFSGSARKVVSMNNSWIFARLHKENQSFDLCDVKFNNITQLNINGYQYRLRGTKIYDLGGEEITSIRIDAGAFSWKETSGSVSGDIAINKR